MFLYFSFSAWTKLYLLIGLKKKRSNQLLEIIENLVGSMGDRGLGISIWNFEIPKHMP